MGTWGPGVFQNDHALDLLSIEEAQLVEALETALGLANVAFDDIEGPLLYVHLLARLAEEHELGEIDRPRVVAWKERYLHIFNSTATQFEDRHPQYVRERRGVIAREFDALIKRTSVPEPPSAPQKKTRAPKAKAPKAPTPKTPTPRARARPRAGR